MLASVLYSAAIGVIVAGVSWAGSRRRREESVQAAVERRIQRRGWDYDLAAFRQRHPSFTHSLGQVRAELAHRVLDDAAVDPDVDRVVVEEQQHTWQIMGDAFAAQESELPASPWIRGLRRYYCLTGVANQLISEMTTPGTEINQRLACGHGIGAVKLAAIVRLAEDKSLLMS